VDNQTAPHLPPLQKAIHHLEPIQSTSSPLLASSDATFQTMNTEFNSPPQLTSQALNQPPAQDNPLSEFSAQSLTPENPTLFDSATRLVNSSHLPDSTAFQAVNQDLNTLPEPPAQALNQTHPVGNHSLELLTQSLTPENPTLLDSATRLVNSSHLPDSTAFQAVTQDLNRLPKPPAPGNDFSAFSAQSLTPENPTLFDSATRLVNSSHMPDSTAFQAVTQDLNRLPDSLTQALNQAPALDNPLSESFIANLAPESPTQAASATLLVKNSFSPETPDFQSFLQEQFDQNIQTSPSYSQSYQTASADPHDPSALVSPSLNDFNFSPSSPSHKETTEPLLARSPTSEGIDPSLPPWNSAQEIKDADFDLTKDSLGSLKSPMDASQDPPVFSSQGGTQSVAALTLPGLLPKQAPSVESSDLPLPQPLENLNPLDPTPHLTPLSSLLGTSFISNQAEPETPSSMPSSAQAFNADQNFDQEPLILSELNPATPLNEDKQAPKTQVSEQSDFFLQDMALNSNVPNALNPEIPKSMPQGPTPEPSITSNTFSLPAFNTNSPSASQEAPPKTPTELSAVEPSTQSNFELADLAFASAALPQITGNPVTAAQEKAVKTPADRTDTQAPFFSLSLDHLNSPTHQPSSPGSAGRDSQDQTEAAHKENPNLQKSNLAQEKTLTQPSQFELNFGDFPNIAAPSNVAEIKISPPIDTPSDSSTLSTSLSSSLQSIPSSNASNPSDAPSPFSQFSESPKPSESADPLAPSNSETAEPNLVAIETPDLINLNPSSSNSSAADEVKLSMNATFFNEAQLGSLPAQSTAQLPKIESQQQAQPNKEKPNKPHSAGGPPDNTQTQNTSPSGLNEIDLLLLLPPGASSVNEYAISKAQTIIGNAADCDLVLFDPAVAARHAKITRKGVRLTLETLDDASTLLNGLVITGPKVLSDQDVITLGPVEIVVSASNRAGKKAAEQRLVTTHSAQEFLPLNDSYSSPEPSKDYTSLPEGTLASLSPEADKKKTLLERYRAMPERQKLIVGLGAVVVMYLVFAPDNEPQKKPPAETPKQTTTQPTTEKLRRFEDLTPEQQKYVAAQHDLALGHFKNQEYDKAIYEIDKIFALVDDYKDSQDIKRYSMEGKRKLEAQLEEENRKAKKAEMIKQIQSLLADATKEKANKNYAKALEILSQIFIIDPDNAAATSLRKEIEQLQDEAQKKLEQDKLQKQIDDSAQQIYDQALASMNRHEFIQCRKLIEEILKSGTLVPGLIDKAHALEVKLHQMIQRLLKPHLARAKQFEDNSEYLEAFQEYSEALLLDPTNKKASLGKARMHAHLVLIAKQHYTEGLLLESYSDFDKAKTSFEYCLKHAPPHSLYATKARDKLKLYFTLPETAAAH
jgi:tetratricopeptide (TPR) repeat protein/pSer/pThr/pTyr-binding forkhead associated (FHA) protein